ncbi:hypothetical protein AVEN_243257-1 [Araneus ventricosus]|uniref:Uncharacterized protein n=1 Tax=Araneus ventricosus TaxID=182803 RepID=A0A4Y2SKG9_ARAVE|nr:hypothetical protein AVEN_243257-1 [Araneus ventricosus]
MRMVPLAAYAPPVAHMRMVRLAAYTTGVARLSTWLREWFGLRMLYHRCSTANGSSGSVYPGGSHANGSSGSTRTGRFPHANSSLQQRLSHRWLTCEWFSERIPLGGMHANGSSAALYHRSGDSSTGCNFRSWLLAA